MPQKKKRTTGKKRRLEEEDLFDDEQDSLGGHNNNSNSDTWNSNQDDLGRHLDISKRHVIELKWYGPPMLSYNAGSSQQEMPSTTVSTTTNHLHLSGEFGHVLNSTEPDIEVLVSSRKLKNQENSPNDMLFRTHLYEFRLIPNKAFIDWGGGRKSGYVVELKLFTRINRVNSNNQSSTTVSSSSLSSALNAQPNANQEEIPSISFLHPADNANQIQNIYQNQSKHEGTWHEYTLCGAPVVTYTFTEDVFSGCWILNLIWPDEKNRINFRGDFCFRLQVYRKVDEYTYRKVWSRISSQIKILSKPGVFLSKQKKQRQNDNTVPAKTEYQHMNSFQQPTFSDQLLPAVTPSTFILNNSANNLVSMNQQMVPQQPLQHFLQNQEQFINFPDQIQLVLPQNYSNSQSFLQPSDFQDLITPTPVPQQKHTDNRKEDSNKDHQITSEVQHVSRASTSSQPSKSPKAAKEAKMATAAAFVNSVKQQNIDDLLCSQSPTNRKGSMLSPTPLHSSFGTPRGLLSLSFSSPVGLSSLGNIGDDSHTNSQLQYQNRSENPQKWDDLFMAAAYSALSEEEEEEGDGSNGDPKKNDFYERMFDTSSK